jgi:hypothetical protein
MLFWRNPFKALDDTPDSPRLGVKLLLIGIALAIVRLSWPHLFPHSFNNASLCYFRHEPYFKKSSEYLSLSDFGYDFWFVVFFLGLLGTFIFFRRGVWWWQDREDERSITRLNLK